MSPSLTIFVLWLAFALTHIGLSSSKVRPRLIAAIGEKGFMGFFSLLAIAIFWPLVQVYFENKHSGPELWSIDLAPGPKGILYLLMGLAFILLAAGVATPSPAAMSSGSSRGPIEPRGIQRITRHAVFMAVGLFGIVHMIPNGDASDVAFFGGFPVFALIGAWHQDRRKLVEDPERYPDFYAATPLIPFTGKETLRGLRELSKPALLAGIAMAGLVRWFHESLFG